MIERVWWFGKRKKELKEISTEWESQRNVEDYWAVLAFLNFAVILKRPVSIVLATFSHSVTNGW